jgi:hypothetical protein
VTNGPRPPTPRPSLFDQVGRAKWDAWSVAGKTWSNESGVVRKDAVQKRYLEAAESVGWTRDTVKMGLSPDNSTLDLERLDEEDDGLSQISNDSPGMRGKVSTLIPKEMHEATASTLYDLAANGELDALKAFLEMNPTCDLNARNTHV